MWRGSCRRILILLPCSSKALRKWLDLSLTVAAFKEKVMWYLPLRANQSGNLDKTLAWCLSFYYDILSMRLGAKAARCPCGHRSPEDGFRTRECLLPGCWKWQGLPSFCLSHSLGAVLEESQGRLPPSWQCHPLKGDTCTLPPFGYQATETMD